MYNYVMYEDDEKFLPILNKNGSESRYTISNYGTIYDTFDEKYMKPRIDKLWRSQTSQFNTVRDAPENKWRAKISLTFDDWSYSGSVARLVLMTFKPLKDYTGMECDHINEDPRDDRLDNLQWISSTENKIKSAANRNRAYTDYHEETVRKVIDMIIDGKGRAEIAETLHVNPRLVNDIKAGRSHKSISAEYIGSGFKIIKQDPAKMFKRQKMVKQICEMIDAGMSNGEIRIALNLPKNETCLPNDIRKLKVYRHISKDYDFYKNNDDKTKKDLKYYKKVFI